MMGLAWIGAGVAALGAGWATWLVISQPQVLRLRRHTSPGAPPRRDAVSVQWIALSGLPLTPARLTLLTWLAGLLAALAILALLRNPVAAVAFGYLASGLPDAYVRQRARKRWDALDRAAMVATTNLTYWLSAGSSVLDSLRRLAKRTDQPFRGWILACLREEAGQVEDAHARVEDIMRQRARGIRHIELMLLADLLAVERRRGSTADSLEELVTQWQLRIRADAKRRGTISGGMLLSRHMITVCIVVLLILGLTHPAAVSSLVGIIVYGIGTIMVATAAFIQRGVARQAEAI